MKNVTKPLTKSVLIPLAIHKEMFGSSSKVNNINNC